MVTRMLIDAAHPEETRVAVVKGNRLEEFDFETSTKKTLKGNIYLAKVTRVEPSLQAAFVDYGGNRHGFLPFGEIHPDYYQIPVADRRALLASEAAEELRAAEAEDASDDAGETASTPVEDRAPPERESGNDQRGDYESGNGEGADDQPAPGNETEMAGSAGADDAPHGDDRGHSDHAHSDEAQTAAAEGEARAPAENESQGNGKPAGDIESLGGDALDEVQRPRRVHVRQYRIQEVIKRRQILLVQVVKEERGTKGAALTTYMSLAGRYCVLMPNTARGGGISRKIVSITDRKRLKSIATDLEVPEGMGVIVRTAGMERSKAEIKRDFEFLLRSWDIIREQTLKSSAPCLIYEDANLIKRAIRDLYTKDIDEVLVEGDDGYRAAKDFMRMLMPSHAKRVQPHGERVPIFQRFQIEHQLDSMYSPVVPLRSGGSVVLGQTEALVAIDVNSGKSTREHNIEETAYKTNLEAAEEIARQLRLRDLAGLVVIDFIDMEVQRNIRGVERRLKECLKADRARIQIGHISPFGLLEMSRQRLRPSLIEASTQLCERCNGRGYVRSTESTALHVLRGIEDEGLRGRNAEITVNVAGIVAIYVLNHKRDAIVDIERRYDMRVLVAADDSLVPPDFRIDRVRGRDTPARIELAPIPTVPMIDTSEPDVEEDADAGEPTETIENTVEEVASPGEDMDAAPLAAGAAETIGDAGRGKRRRRGGRRRRRDGSPAVERPPRAPRPMPDVAAQPPEHTEMAEPAGNGDAEAGSSPDAEAGPGISGGDEAERKRRRRGRRGGRRRRRREDGSPIPAQGTTDAQPQANETETRSDSYEESQPQGHAPSVSPADIAAELWPHFDPGGPGDNAAENVPARAEKNAERHGERGEPENRVESRPESLRQAETPAHASAARPVPATPEPPAAMPPPTSPEPANEAPVVESETASPSPQKTGWWRRR